MSSLCRASMVAAALMAVAGCDRETRDYRGSPLPETGPQLSSGLDPRGHSYEINAFHISNGARYYTAFNCNGCHGSGGGGMGPPLIDDEWRYGGNMEDIVRSILGGRPNGMPAFNGRITEQQAWEIAAYVRSLGAHTPADTRAGRTDDVQSREPLSLEEPMAPTRATPEQDTSTKEDNPE